MNQTEFEQLSRSLLDVIKEVRDDESLLKIAMLLLNAEIALLLRCESGNKEGEYELVRVYPQKYQTSLKTSFKNLREWYVDLLDDLPTDFDGFAKERSLEVAGEKFPGALVAFGERSLHKSTPMHEIILIKKPEDHSYYGSYHSWAAANLLRQFEFINLQRSLAKEINVREQYVESLIKDILPDEPWEGLVERTKDQPLNMRWFLYAMWTSYQVGADRAVDNGLYDRLKGKKKKSIQIFADAVRFFLNFSSIDKQWFDKIKKGILPKPKSPWPDMDDGDRFRLITQLLEHGWRKLRLTATLGGFGDRFNAKEHSVSQVSGHQEMDLSEMVESALDLLCLTRGLVVRTLMIAKDPIEDKTYNDGFNDVDRKFLRLYFALEIAQPDSRLSQLYLSKKLENDQITAPPELKRTFVVNLARFMLSVIRILQERLDISTRLKIISYSEEIDSLLYLIDRFIHVELQVEEQLNIREHLSRQIAAEVFHHLTRPHYRDHLLHVIDVFLLGYLLLKTKFKWIDEYKVSLVNHLIHLADHQKDKVDWPVREDSWLKNWAVASLFHDIGYQIGHGEKISREPDSWESYFQLIEPVYPRWLQFKGVEINGPDSQYSGGYLENLKQLVENFCKQPLLEKFLPRQIDYNIFDHGMLSALRVAQILYHTDHQNQMEENLDKDGHTFYYGHAIHAIAHHNLYRHKVRFDSHPLSCLLRLCDELQEWDRNRVNIEKVVKRLYLDLQQGSLEEIPAFQMFKSFKSNLDFKPVSKDGFAESIEVSLATKDPWFKFILIYHDPMEAHFDPTMTLLGKAYNLQHLDFDVSKQEPKNLKFSIDLRFPSPREYGDLTEYDIYGLFTQQVRSLPLLYQFDTVEEAGRAGLIRLNNEGKLPRGDCFAIVLTQKSSIELREGWLHTDPSIFFSKFNDFKKMILLPAAGRI